MSSTIRIKGRPWYYRLYRVDSTQGLFDFHPIETLEGKILVQYELPPNYEPVKRVFGLFDSIAEFRQYVENFPLHERCFYESIIGRFRQKPHFDIDFEGESEEEIKIRSNTLLLNLCNSIAYVLSPHGIALSRENLLIYTSHGQKGNHYKRSFHLLIDGYYHHNNVEAEAFYQRVMTQLINIPDREHIDHAVYGTIQQFRMLGSQKYGSNRPKMPQGGWPVFENYFAEITACRRSLVSDCGNCLPLPSFVIPVSSKYSHENTSLSENEVREVEEIVATHNYTRECASIREITGSIIALRREHESVCPTCNRIHEGENPFLAVDRHGEIWFFCRRSDERSSMGFIRRDQPEETEFIAEEEEVPEEVVEIPLLPPPQRINVLELARQSLKLPSRTSAMDGYLC